MSILLGTKSLPDQPGPACWPELPENGPPPLIPSEVGLPASFAPTPHIRQIDGHVAQLWTQLDVETFGEASVWVDVTTGRVI